MKPARPRGIQSVETGLAVLTALADCGQAAALSTVARRAKLSPSQAHRYLSSLVSGGVARQDSGGLYDLGPGALRLGLAALARTDLFAEADRAFAAFARQTGRTCMLCVWGNAGPTVVRWFPGKPAVLTSLAVGSVLPLDQSATGRVFQALGDEPADWAGDIRAALSASVDGSLIPGLRATAAPVFDLQGRLALVATAIATAFFDPAGDAAALAALHAACRTVTQAIGGRWPP